VKKIFKGPVAVAGGLNKHSAPKAVASGASIVVVGSAITKSDKPGVATREIVETLSRRF